MEYDIVWYGRGGQGLVVAAHILAEAAYLEGFKGVTSAPQFGPERRGAPLTASTRIAPQKVRRVSKIAKADFAVVLDVSLLNVLDIKGSLKENSTIIFNTNSSPESFIDYASYKIATCNAFQIAKDLNIIKDGKFIINTPMLGAFAKVFGIVSIKSFEKIFSKRFKGQIYSSNYTALKTAYETTLIKN